MYQTKDEKLIPYKRMVDDLKKYFAHITFQQVPRVDNKAADVMGTLVSLLQMPENDRSSLMHLACQYVMKQSPLWSNYPT
ncbi:hypothetical protein P3S38_29290 [Enterobacter hormaechei]|uniref:hypothetical protein n=1 Tax=Enterobacter hormaechei TaxID=158836 RepID=UPI0023E35DE5|nr:hypothetical protein [Enterobacter hormaechei]MDF3681073.1 hypothetical protein [Enterobacter hormaechei]